MRYAANGGVVYYSLGEYLHGFPGADLLSVELRDFTLSHDEQRSFTWRDRTYTVDWTVSRDSHRQIPVVATTTAEVLACYPNGAPALTRRPLGLGAVYFLNAPYEAQLDIPYRLTGNRWESLYAELAASAGLTPILGCDAPDVEVSDAVDRRRHLTFVINHAPHPVATALVWSTPPASVRRLELESKAVHVFRWEDEPLVGEDERHRIASGVGDAQLGTAP
jgi:hypothetical protein